MFRRGVEVHIAERHAEVHIAERHALTPVLSGKIALIDQSPVAGDDDPMSVSFFQGFESRADTADQRGIETFLVGRGYGPTIVEIGRLWTLRRDRGHRD